MVIPSGTLAVVLFEIMTGVIVGIALFDRWIFTPESAIYNVYFVAELGGVLILFIKIFLGDILLIIYIINPNHHSRPFKLPPSVFL